MAEQISNATARLELILGHERLARLESACVMVLGLGGVGSNCVEALARGGIGHFVLVDADTVEASNLNRQAIAFVHTLGQRKTDATRNLILDINPAAEVKTLNAFLLKACGSPLGSGEGRVFYFQHGRRQQDTSRTA